MGTFLSVAISHSVKRKEWEDVYDEVLQLVEAFPLAELVQVPIRGYETWCLVRTKEREEYRSWFKSDGKSRCWIAGGDYEHLDVAESFSLWRDEIDDRDHDADAPDAMLDCVSYCIDDQVQKYGEFKESRRLWGNKTLGGTFHLYLLAIACLIETRLGRKAYVYGDMYQTQCEYAVRMANGHLATPVREPACCDAERLLARVSDLPLAEDDKICVFTSEYLGTKDAPFGACIREHFSKDAYDQYWKGRFRKYSVKSTFFNEELKNYLEWGFDLEGLCSLVRLTDDQGRTYHETFVRKLMDTKLHLSSERASTGGDKQEFLNYLVAQCALAKASYTRVDRYIPLEEIRSTLSRAMGDVCPTGEIIDKYLLQERQEALDVIAAELMKKDDGEEATPKADHSYILRDIIATEILVNDGGGEYDIVRPQRLTYFEVGDTLIPSLREAVARSYVFCRSLLDEGIYQNLMRRSPEQRFAWLARTNQHLVLRDIDWEKIYDEVVDRREAFERYYPMVRVDANGSGLREMLTAFVINDDLYAYAADAAAGLEASETDEDDYYVFKRTYELDPTIR